MAVIDPAVPGPGELDDALPGRAREASRRGPAAVAMDDPVDAVRPETPEQAPGRPLTAGQQGGGLGRGQGALPPPAQNIDPLLISCVQRQSLLHLWRLTNSLSS